MDVVTLGAALSIMKKMPDTAASSAAAAEDAADRAEEAARTLTIDSTLTQPGQPADAKAVGSLKEDLNKVISDFSGYSVDFYSDGSALKSCVLELPLKQEGSDTPNGTNIRNITPTTSATVTLNGDDTTVTFGTGGIVKGTRNLSTGEQTSEYGLYEFDGSESWALHGTNPSWFYLYYTLAGAYTNDNKNDFAASNKYVQGKASDNNVLTDGRFTIGMVGTNMRIVIRDTRFTTLSAFLADMTTNHLQIAYKYETPVETEHTSVTLQTENGLNTISSNIGTLTFSAKQSVEDYVTRVTEPIYGVTFFTQDDFEQGTIDSNGYPASNNYRIRFKNYYRATMDFYVANADGYDINLFKYTDNGTLISTTGFAGGGEIHKYPVSKGDRIKIALGKYPIALTSTSDYVGLEVVDVNNFDKFAVEIASLEADVTAQTNARIASVKDSANFSKSENLTFYSHAYYVGADKEYTTINQALTAWANDNYPPAVVYISNGEYKETVFVEDRTIAFIGESRDGVLVRTTQGNYTYPPFKIHHGNVLIANLTAIADHSENPDFVYNQSATMAYAFHIDGGTVGGVVHIKDVTAISHQSPSFGMGTIPNSKIRLENVDAYSYTASGSGESLNSGNILCHLASPTIYPTAGTETIELININAYAENTKRVIFLSQGNSENTLAIKAINTATASGVSDIQDELVILPTNYSLSSLSSGNTCDLINA